MRIMRLLVMFDLPTKTKADKDNYIKFKRFLDDDGYQREQNSVYSRNLLSRASSESHADQLRKHLPPEAIAHVLMETRSHAALPPMTHQLRFQVWVKGITPLSSSTTSFPISRRAISPTDGLNAPVSEAAPDLSPKNSAPAPLCLSQVYRDRTSIAR